MTKKGPRDTPGPTSEATGVPTTASPAEDDRRPLIRFTKPAKITTALVCIGLAVAHFVRPQLPIDATFLGLLVAAVAVLLGFFDNIESIDAFGIHTRVTRKQIERADAVVKATVIAAGPVAIPTAPPIAAEAHETITLTEEAHAALQPVALMPPADPGERLLWAAEQIRVELIVLAGNTGNLKDLKERPPWEDYNPVLVATALGTKDVLPTELFSPISTVIAARHNLVHGRLRPRVHIALAASLATDVLEKLREVKRNYIRVREGDVELFKDQLMTTVLQEARGVMLIEINDQGVVSKTSVFPRGAAYARGAFVSWEWDLSHVIRREAWYRDPGTKTAKLAWSRCATFIGRPYPPQWGLEYRFPRPDVGMD